MNADQFGCWRTKSNRAFVISVNSIASHSRACRKSVHDYRRDFSGVTDLDGDLTLLEAVWLA